MRCEVACWWSGSALLAEGQGGDGGAERRRQGGGDGVAVVFWGAAGEVGDRGGQAEALADAAEAEQLAQLRCPADLARLQVGVERDGGGDRGGRDAEILGEVPVGGDLDVHVEAGGK